MNQKDTIRKLLSATFMALASGSMASRAEACNYNEIDRGWFWTSATTYDHLCQDIHTGAVRADPSSPQPYNPYWETNKKPDFPGYKPVSTAECLDPSLVDALGGDIAGCRVGLGLGPASATGNTEAIATGGGAEGANGSGNSAPGVGTSVIDGNSPDAGRPGVVASNTQTLPSMSPQENKAGAIGHPPEGVVGEPAELLLPEVPEVGQPVEVQPVEVLREPPAPPASHATAQPTDRKPSGAQDGSGPTPPATKGSEPTVDKCAKVVNWFEGVRRGCW